jgi:cytochrome c oxidase subunit II
MKQWRGVALATTLLCGGIVSMVLAQKVSSAGDAPAVIRMTAKRYEFAPTEIHVKEGNRVRLEIRALDREHGFKLEAFHIDQTLAKGETAVVEFTADRAGTFPFKCSHFCGLGHKKMKGRFIVE